MRGPARLLIGERLDLQCEDAASLEVVPGIGPSRARSIAEARARKALRSVESLDEVHGIGPKTVAALERWVRVSGEDCAPVAQQAKPDVDSPRDEYDGEEGAGR